MVLVYEKPAGECTRLVEIINTTNDIQLTK